MGPRSLSLKAKILGSECDKIVSSWKQECEVDVEKQHCRELMKDHLQQVNYLPQLPCIREVKQFLSEGKQSMASDGNTTVMNISNTINSEGDSTLDLSSLNLCCDFSPKDVLKSTCTRLHEIGLRKNVVLQCLEDVAEQSCDDTNIPDALVHLVESKHESYPSYQIIGDNVDLDVKVRHMENNNKNKSFHWFNLIAFKDQVSGSHLPDVHNKTLADVPISAFLPSQADIQLLKQDFAVMWSRVIVKHFREFAFLRKAVIYHIPHAYSQIMTEPVEEVCTCTYRLTL